MITVRFTGALRHLAGGPEIQLREPASGRLRDVLDTLEARIPGILGGSTEFQWRHGATHVMVTMNGHIVDQGAGEANDAPVANGDVITLVAPLGGG